MDQDLGKPERHPDRSQFRLSTIRSDINSRMLEFNEASWLASGQCGFCTPALDYWQFDKTQPVSTLAEYSIIPEPIRYMPFYELFGAEGDPTAVTDGKLVRASKCFDDITSYYSEVGQLRPIDPFGVIAANILVDKDWGASGVYPHFLSVIPKTMLPSQTTKLVLRDGERGPNEIERKIAPPILKKLLIELAREGFFYNGKLFLNATRDPSLRDIDYDLLDYIENVLGPTSSVLLLGPTQSGKSSARETLSSFKQQLLEHSFILDGKRIEIEEGENGLQPFNADAPHNLFTEARRLMQEGFRGDKQLLVEASAVDSFAGIIYKTQRMVGALIEGMRGIFGENTELGPINNNVLLSLMPDRYHRYSPVLTTTMLSKIVAGELHGIGVPVLDSLEGYRGLTSGTGILDNFILTRPHSDMVKFIRESGLEMGHRVVDNNGRTVYDVGQWVVENFGRLYAGSSPQMQAGLSLGLINGADFFPHLTSVNKDIQMPRNIWSENISYMYNMFVLDKIGSIKVTGDNSVLKRNSQGQLSFRNLIGKIEPNAPYSAKLSDLLFFADILSCGTIAHQRLAEYIYGLVVISTYLRDKHVKKTSD